MTMPNSVVVDGNLKVLFVPAIANPGAPTVSELTAATALDLTCYLSAWTPGTEEATVADNRLCSKNNPERPGRVTETLEIQYVYDPQNAVVADNKAYTTMTPGTTGFLVTRSGLPFETAITAGQKVDVFPITFGERRKQAVEENSVFRITQKPFVRGNVRRDVAIAT